MVDLQRMYNHLPVHAYVEAARRLRWIFQTIQVPFLIMRGRSAAVGANLGRQQGPDGCTAGSGA